MLLEIKIIIVAVAMIIIGVLGWYLPNHYRGQGRDEVRAEYAERVRVAIVERNAENEALKQKQALINQKVVEEYENKLRQQKTAYDLRIAAIRNDGGLRVPASACSRFAAKANTESAGRDYETISYRLPIRVEDGLFELARKADQVNTQLGACQNWIKDNELDK